MFYKKCLDQVWSPLLNVSSFWQWNWQILLEPGPSLSPSCPGCVSWGKALPPLSLFTLKQEDLLLPMPLSFLSEQWLLHNTGMLAMSATWWLKRVWMHVLSELRHTDEDYGAEYPMSWNPPGRQLRGRYLLLYVADSRLLNERLSLYFSIAFLWFPFFTSSLPSSFRTLALSTSPAEGTRCKFRRGKNHGAGAWQRSTRSLWHRLV